MNSVVGMCDELVGKSAFSVRQTCLVLNDLQRRVVPARSLHLLRMLTLLRPAFCRHLRVVTSCVFIPWL